MNHADAGYAVPGGMFYSNSGVPNVTAILTLRVFSSTAIRVLDIFPLFNHGKLQSFCYSRHDYPSLVNIYICTKD